MPSFKAQILGTGSAFPQRSVPNTELEKKVETSDEWIYERTGIRRRRIADISAGETNSALAAKAAQQALDAAGLQPNDIDRIFVATVSPDHVMPSTACLVQEKLGARRAGALDLSAACSGFVYGLEIANSLVRTGAVENVLLIGSEVLSSIVNWEDRGTCILFGDGAGATVIGRAPSSSKSEIYSTHLYANGWAKDLFFLPAGGSTMPTSASVLENKLQFVQMKGKEIFKVAVKMLADCSLEALNKNGYALKDISWIVPHQANLRIIEALAKRLDFPMERVIVNIEDYGNTSAATVPTAFDRAVREGRIQRGDLVLFTVFGAGLTYGSALLRY